MLLIGWALAQIGPATLGREGFAERFTTTLIHKTSQWEGLVEETDLPMVRQVVIAFFAGQDPVAWRDQAGLVPDSEPRAMTCALAQIAEFVDLVDGPGACERTLLASLGEPSQENRWLLAATQDRISELRRQRDETR
ncbi:hypothetical protein [Streptomyces sp. WM6378]|uniref:hypothetical protein n=1 Tax=Streptomyces sp. WM6378 TaxID=1415557 RepID=UPI0006AEDA30|nr:hypothetical protein [Streptomyces sp. WM6378]